MGLLLGGGFVTLLICWEAANGNWGIAVAVLALALAAVGVMERWAWAPFCGLALAALIPYSLWAMLTGGTDGALLSRVHPATIYTLALAGLGWEPPRGWQQTFVSPKRRIALALQFMFLVGAGLMSVAVRGMRGLPLLVDNYIGPFLVFWMLVGTFDGKAGARERAGNWVAFAGVVLSVAAVLEVAAGRNPLYEPTYGDVPWFPFPTGEYRSTVTFAAPLAAANVLLFSLAVTSVVSSARLRLWAVMALLLGILATGSRSATAIGLLISPAVITASGEQHRLIARVRSKRTGALLLGAFALVAGTLVTPLGRHVLERATSSWESTAVRVVSANYFAQTAGVYLVKGVGLGGSTDVSTAVFGSYITFENPWIMLAVDLGIPLVILYVATLIAGVWAVVSRPAVRWGVLAGVIGVVGFETAYNSFGVRSIAAYVLWVAVSFLCDNSSSYTTAREA